MASNSIKNYISNVAESIKYAAIEVIKEKMPVTGGFIEQNKDVVKNIYKDLITSKQHLLRIGSIQDNTLFRKVDQMFTNIKTDLRSGKFYHDDRGDPMEMLGAMGSLMEGLGGAGGDFDLNSLFAELDEDKQPEAQAGPQPEKVVTKGDALISAAIFKSQARSSNCIGKVLTSLHEHGQRTNRAYAAVQLRHAEKSLFIARAGWTSMVEGFNRIITFNNEVMGVHAQNSQKFYTEMTNVAKDSNAILHKIHDIHETLNKVQLQEEKKKGNASDNEDLIDFQALFKNGLDIGSYQNLLKSRLKKSPISLMYNLLGMLPMMMNSFVESPLHEFTKIVITSLLGGATTYALKRLDKTIEGAFVTGLAKLHDYGEKHGGIKGAIASFFGVKDKTSSSLASIDTGKYNKGAMSWNGIAQKALVEVIPSYLARIEATLTGQGERHMDFKEGKFLSLEEMRKKMDDFESSIDISQIDVINKRYEQIAGSLNKMVKEGQLDREVADNQLKKIRSGISAVSRIGYMPNLKEFDTNPELYGGQDTAAIVKTMFASLDKSEQTHLGVDFAKANRTRKETIENLDQNNPLYKVLTNTLVGAIERKPGMDLSKSQIPGLTDLTQLQDHRHKTLYDYQNLILEQLVIANNLTRRGRNGNGPEGSSSNIIVDSHGNPIPPGSGRSSSSDSIYSEVKFDNNFGVGKAEERKTSAVTDVTDQRASAEKKYAKDKQELIEKIKKEAEDKIRGGIQNLTDEELEELVDEYLSTGKLNADSFTHKVSEDGKVELGEATKLITAIIQKSAYKDKQKKIKENSGFLSGLLGWDKLDHDKYHKLPEGISPNDSMITQLLKAGTVGQKFDVIRHNIDALKDAPSAMLASLIGKAEESIYDILFGKETGQVDEDGKPVKGLFGRMMAFFDKHDSKANGFFDNILKKFQKWFTDEDSLLSKGMKWIGEAAGFDFKETIGKLKDGTKDAVAATNTAFSKAVSELWKDLGIMTDNGKLLFGDTAPNKNPSKNKKNPTSTDQSEKTAEGTADNTNQDQTDTTEQEQTEEKPADTNQDISTAATGTPRINSSLVALTGGEKLVNYATGQMTTVPMTGVYETRRLGNGDDDIGVIPRTRNPFEQAKDAEKEAQEVNKLGYKYISGSDSSIKGYAEGTEIKDGGLGTILQKLSQAGVSAEEVNKLIEVDPKDRVKLIAQIVKDVKARGKYQGESKALSKLLSQFTRRTSGAKFSDSIHAQVSGIVENDAGQLSFGSKFDRAKVDQLVSNDNIKDKSNKERNNIRAGLTAAGAGHLMASDEELDNRKFSKKEGPITGIRQFMTLMTGTDPKRAAEMAKDYISKNCRCIVICCIPTWWSINGCSCRCRSQYS